MSQFTERTAMLIGEEAVAVLASSRVCLFGVGGVGSYTAETLARAGVGEITLVDGDVVSASNINRQLVALNSTVGHDKVEVMANRIADINPICRVTPLRLFYGAGNADAVDFSRFDCVIDAIDTVTSKLLIIERSVKAGVWVISCMGAGNKLDPARFEVADISKTSVCPLARVMRRELRNRGIERLPVIYSREEPCVNGGRVPASISFVPAAAGLLLAGEAIKHIIYGSKNS